MGKRRGEATERGDAAVRKALAAVSARLEAIGAGMAEAFRNEIPAYMGIRDSARIAGIEEACRAHAGAVLAHLKSGSAPSEEELRGLGEVGRQRFEQGVPLSDLIHAYELGTHAILDAIDQELKRVATSPEHHSTMLTSVAAGVHELSTQLLTAARRAYHEAERATMVKGRAFRDALDDLLDGKTVAGEGARAPLASVIGMMPGEFHVIAIVEIAGIADPRALDAHLTCLAGAAATPLAAVGQRSCWVRRGRSVVMFVAFNGERNNRAVADALGHAVRNVTLPAQARALASVGECAPGVEGIAESYRQAGEVIAFLRGKEALGPVMIHRDVLPYLMMAKVPALANGILRRGVERLVIHDSANGTAFVASLEAYIDCWGNASEAAKRLHVHRHTLVSHVQQIERITGMDLRNREDVRLLDLGLMALRILPVRAAG